MGLMIYLKAVCVCVSVWLYYRKQDFKRDDNILIEFVLSDEVELLSCVRLFATPWTVAYNAPPAMGFSRQEYWSGLPFGYFFFYTCFGIFIFKDEHENIHNILFNATNFLSKHFLSLSFLNSEFLIILHYESLCAYFDFILESYYTLEELKCLARSTVFAEVFT